MLNAISTDRGHSDLGARRRRVDVAAGLAAGPAAGEMPLAPEVVARLVASYVLRPPAAPAPSHRLDPLSDRERDVLALLGAGRSNPEIAAELFVSLATVKSHVRHILGKLDGHDRAQAIVLAHECALVARGIAR